MEFKQIPIELEFRKKNGKIVKVTAKKTVYGKKFISAYDPLIAKRVPFMVENNWAISCVSDYQCKEKRLGKE